DGARATLCRSSPTRWRAPVPPGARCGSGAPRPPAMYAFLRNAAKQAVLASMHARTMRGAALSQPPALWDLTKSASGRLAWDGVELVDLASRFGTPLHVVSRVRLEKD